MLIRGCAGAVALIAVGVACVSCGGGDSPSSTPVAPTSTPTVAPAPTPTPTPTPTPSVESPVLPQSCEGAAPTGNPNGCRERSTPVLREQFQAALDRAAARGTEIFYEDGRTIRYLDRFREEVLSGLDDQGICGMFDFGNIMGDEIYLLSADGTISEVWDAITGSGNPRSGYLTTCEPALPFPDPPPSYANSDPTCPLPPSRATFCLDRSFDSLYFNQVRDAIAKVTEEKPHLFDFDDQESGELSYALTDPEEYVSSVVENLRQAGFCAIPGEELAVKLDNSVNENFDILRHPPNGKAYSWVSYRGRCHNALF